MVAANTALAPAPRNARAPAARVPPVVATSSTRSTVAPATRRNARSRGPARRACASSPVWAGPGDRCNVATARTPMMRATARARSSPWSTPCARRRASLAGAHVTRSIAAGATPTAAASSWATHATNRRSLRYLARATSSRATPSYEKHAAHHSTGGGGGATGAGASVVEHRAHTNAPRRPHPGHRAGNTASSASANKSRPSILIDERGLVGEAGRPMTGDATRPVRQSPRRAARGPATTAGTVGAPRRIRSGPR